MKNTSLITPPWTIKDLLLYFVGVVTLLGLLIAAGRQWFASGDFFLEWSESYFNTFLYLIQTFVLLLPLYVILRIRHKSTDKDLELNPVKLKPFAANIGLGFLLYYIISAVVVQIQWSYEVEIPGYGDQESHIPLFGESMNGLIVGGVILVLIAPLAEEMLFRGFLYGTLKKYLKPFWAATLSSLIFGLFHMEFTVIIPLFMLGMILCWVMERSKSLWTAVGFHMLNNAFAFAIEIALFYEWISLPE
jgi:membrane protease YdiL (CAAX protease family)